MTQLEQLDAATQSVKAYSQLMEETTGWTCQATPEGLAWFDPYGDQSGELWECLADLVAETYDEIADALI